MRRERALHAARLIHSAVQTLSGPAAEGLPAVVHAADAVLPHSKVETKVPLAIREDENRVTDSEDEKDISGSVRGGEKKSGFEFKLCRAGRKGTEKLFALGPLARNSNLAEQNAPHRPTGSTATSGSLCSSPFDPDAKAPGKENVDPRKVDEKDQRVSAHEEKKRADPFPHQCSKVRKTNAQTRKRTCFLGLVDPHTKIMSYFRLYRDREVGFCGQVQRDIRESDFDDDCQTDDGQIEVAQSDLEDEIMAAKLEIERVPFRGKELVRNSRFNPLFSRKLCAGLLVAPKGKSI